jgi:hypothetical protein
MAARTRQPANRESKARALFRQAGFRVESVSFIRGANDEFMSIVCFPGTDAWTAVRLLTDPGNDTLEITRIHTGRDNGMNRGNVEVRVYVRFISQPQPSMSYAEMEAAMRKATR